MTRHILLLTFVFSFTAYATTLSDSTSRSGRITDGPYVPVEKFDPSRDAAMDISEAIAEAASTGKRIILDVGGDWCIWCKRLDSLFIRNTSLRSLLHSSFVVVKVNFSSENKNEEVLSRYPEIEGYPHLFVLESDGTLLHSQDTGLLESGKAHDPAKVREFLERWAPVPAERNPEYAK